MLRSDGVMTMEARSRGPISGETRPAPWRAPPRVLAGLGFISHAAQMVCALANWHPVRKRHNVGAPAFDRDHSDNLDVAAINARGNLRVIQPFPSGNRGGLDLSHGLHDVHRRHLCSPGLFGPDAESME